jgi:hypothetical protein
VKNALIDAFRTLALPGCNAKEGRGEPNISGDEMNHPNTYRLSQRDQALAWMHFSGTPMADIARDGRSDDPGLMEMACDSLRFEAAYADPSTAEGRALIAGIDRLFLALSMLEIQDDTQQMAA